MRKTCVLQLTLNQRDDDYPEEEQVGDIALEEEEALLAPPPLYQVIMFDDDFTPMEFVVEVLELLFSMNREKATQVMLTVHTKGKAACGTYTKDVAETKVAQVIQYARENQHPLLCEVQQLIA
ncbi:MAG: ATP-dependent Clp protease adapter ClpS [Pseudomonadales bacterium]|nr:ATP-dependent Clp protease adapter ClpS [Pseudomonadales bacterium]